MSAYKLYEIHSGNPVFVGRTAKQDELQKFMDKKLGEGVFKAVIEVRL